MNKKSQDFQDHYDRLSLKYGDPVEVLFEIAFDPHVAPSDRRAAASDLCSFRYPKIKAIEMDIKGGEGMTFVMVGPDMRPAEGMSARDEFAVSPPPLPALEVVK